MTTEIKLCRICSSQGFLSINNKCRPEIVMTNSDYKKYWDITIKQMIQEVSGEMISEDDILPKFICTYCSYYLQHAYTMKIKMKSNAEDLRASLELAQGHESLNTTSGFRSSSNSANKQEILRDEDEITEESYLYNAFKDLNIEISYVDTGTDEDKKVRLFENKCDACKQRFLDPNSYEKHMETCLVHHLDKFYLDSEELLREKVTEKINYDEYIVRSTHSIRNISKRLFDHKYKSNMISMSSDTKSDGISSSTKKQPKNVDRRSIFSRFTKNKFRQLNPVEAKSEISNFLSDHGYGSSSCGSGQESKHST